ncbi:hypothetical protein FBULB1_5912 [Fusarium bulbicola]|nr:hypothetical protein FBULB1_5912 [Fusarium bulbicola]
MAWTCEVCGEELAAKKTLKDHHRIHTGEKPFECRWKGCEKKFRLRHHRDKHEKTTSPHRHCDEFVEYASHLTNEFLSMAERSQPMPFTNPNSSDRFSHPANPHVDFESQVRGHPIQHHDNQQGPPANFSYELETNFAPKQYEDCITRVVLNIAGNLESMAENWTPEEWGNRRRIVLFRKTQKGSTVNATCQPVGVNERPTNGICISCIWWAEKGECYVTSVDTIHLLEQLVAAPNRFSVEEKDRIRRNLEGFHPKTVSETKPDSEEFFKIIMGFPNPKPRNIERDIKVYPWRILGGALKKILGKYSISPSDTVPALNIVPGQRVLLPPQTSTTSQQACPVTELLQEFEQFATDPSNLAPEAEMLIDDYPSAFHAELVNGNILPEGSWYDYLESQPAQSHKAPDADMEQQKEGIQSDYVSVCESLAQRDAPVDPVLLLDAEIDSNSKQAAIPRVSTEGVFDYPHCTRTSGDVRDYGHGKIDGRTNDAPQLRTSTIPRKTGTNSNCHTSDQAVLKIAGNLESMAENWTPEESTNCRRIVVFHRTQKGSILNTTFESLNINSQFDGRACVSCIWWAGQGECYITSADIILLAEYLVDAKESFTSKEATIIRSKLDMFYPITVSAKDLGSQGFHKIVVGFSHPEPFLSRKKRVKVYLWNELESALESALKVIITKRYGFGLGSTRANPRPPRYLMSRPQTLNSTSLHMGPSHHAPLSSASFTGLPSSVDQAPPAEDAHETLQQDCVPRAEAAAPSSANANRIYSDTGERPLKYQGMDCNSISQPQTYLTHVQGTRNSPSTPELELPVLSTSNIIWEVHSEIPHQARPDPDSNLTSPKSESSLPETFIHDESDSDSAESTIVVGARPGHDKQNAPTLPVDKHIDGVDDTYKDNEEKARGSKPSVTYDDDDWGYAIADGKITIHCKNTLLTNFDREVPVRGMCPGVQRILDRIHELFLKGDIKKQQEVEAESEQIHIKGRTRPMTQRNISFSENTEQQQSSEVTYATIDELQKMLPESKGLDLSRISKSELDVILKAVQEVLNTIQQVLITSWIEEAEPAKQLLDEIQRYCSYEWH